MSNVGVSLLDNCNNPDTPSCGYFPLETAIDGGERVSAFTAYLSKSVAQERINTLSVCTGAIASRLESGHREEGGLVATGVYIRPASKTHPDKDYFVKARREIVLCCGAMTTPQLLLLSGIGPGGVESPQTTLGIPLVKELPAVGAGFSDHYGIPIMLEIPRKETIHFLETALWGLWHMILWLFARTGMISRTTAPTALFLRTDSIDAETMQIKAPEMGKSSQYYVLPNIEIMMIPINTLERPVPGRSLFSLFPTLLRPSSPGRLEITSTDPLVNPKITHPMFAHEDDVKAARLAVRFSMRLAAEFQTLYPFPAPIAFAPGNYHKSLIEWEKTGDVVQSPVIEKIIEGPPANKTWRDVTDDEIDDYMRRVSHTALHFSSTCPMGIDEKLAVVDQRLLVHGFANLRVADASVLPRVTTAHTMAPILMVAERCADFIKATWEELNM